ncbi:unnamed protein product [Polarella glacialis]|uniref:Selenoprotein O n=1 Tax=Polarella glacialis TaxID=89957 RepID=A0A813I914_POLGL|nr:unnamed protein product [Polarella glacialis]
MSIAEVVHEGQRWELQLKGAGRTPFSRQFDGRAVLRSSVREFLASECMHALGVPTTRALSLVASDSERVSRPWYPPPQESSKAAVRPPHPPSCLVEEKTAVLCRCAPSFLRVGHVELLVMRDSAVSVLEDNSKEKQELEELIWHVVEREYPHLLEKQLAFPDLVATMFEEFVQRQAFLTSEWLRVGYVQGNMNSDNCLLGGRTLDYGPFAFMESFDRDFQPFTSDIFGTYAFARQPLAAKTNAATLASALLAAFGAEGSGIFGGGKLQSRTALRLKGQLQASVEGFSEHFRSAHRDSCRRKLGLASWDEDTNDLWNDLLDLMQATQADFTVLFRLLSGVVVLPLAELARAFPDEKLDSDAEDAWQSWLERFLYARTQQ